MKHFVFTYKENKKNNNIELHRKISLSKSVGDISIDAHNALGIFMSSTGNLKKYDIISIQEIDEDGKFIGEPITPFEDTSIVPIKRR